MIRFHAYLETINYIATYIWNIFMLKPFMDRFILLKIAFGVSMNGGTLEPSIIRWLTHQGAGSTLHPVRTKPICFSLGYDTSVYGYTACVLEGGGNDHSSDFARTEGRFVRVW